MEGEAEDEERVIESLTSSMGLTGSEAGVLLPRIYSELRSMADRLMNNERGRHTLQPTALVHEAFLRIGEGQCMSRLTYLATAAQVMRRILIDHARRRDAQKRGGAWKRVTLQGLSGDSNVESELDVLLLDEALVELAKLDPRQARIVELRFFSGMTGQEIAEHLDTSRNTVVRDLTMARAWLQRALSQAE